MRKKYFQPNATSNYGQENLAPFNEIISRNERTAQAVVGGRFPLQLKFTLPHTPANSDDMYSTLSEQKKGFLKEIVFDTLEHNN